MTTILVTGFEPFGRHRTNVSAALVKTLRRASWPTRQGIRVATAILPTEFHRAGDRIVELIRDLEPDAVICCGLARRRKVLTFERVARNRDACARPDNQGEKRSRVPIVARAPASYAGTLPYARMSRALAAVGIAHRYSDNAGGFVCNHVFYRASHEIAGSGRAALCGFIHWPPAAAVAGGAPATSAVAALRLCITEIACHIANSPGRRPRARPVAAPWRLRTRASVG